MKVPQLKRFTIVVLLSLGLFSCSKNDDNTASSGSSSSHKVIFKVTQSNDVSLDVPTRISYQIAGNITYLPPTSQVTWVSTEMVSPKGDKIIYILATMYGSNASSWVKVQIYVDGTLVKENSNTGKGVLTTTCTYEF